MPQNLSRTAAVNFFLRQPYDSQERERERIALVHSASLAYEDGSVFMSIAMGPDTVQ